MMENLGSSKLTPEQNAQRRDQGYYFPVRDFDDAEAGIFRERFKENLGGA